MKWSYDVRDMQAQLAWVHRNRSRANRSAPLADIIQRWAKGVENQDSELIRQLVTELDGMVDDTFRCCCLIHGLHEGEVLVNVSDASAVGWMRRTWRSKILEVARTRFPRAKIHDVKFAFGTIGKAVGTADEACQ